MTYNAARHPRPARSTRALALSVCALGIALSLAAAPSSASAITRDQVLARAQVRVDAPVTYSQTKYYNGYRTDCSGYVSYCWATGTSWATSSFYRVSYRITTSQLAPGDALLKKGYHIRLFYGWLDEAHTQYVAYEAADGKIAGCRIHAIADDLRFGYVPTRYTRITNSPASLNLLKNPGFDSWTTSWGTNAEQPVWWRVDGLLGQKLVLRRQDTYHTSRDSLQLQNSSGDTSTVTELSESVPIVPNASYRLTAWAATSFDPHGVELRLTYLNAAGQSIAETYTTGDQANLIGASYRPISVLATTPPDATRALVSVRLAGCTTPVDGKAPRLGSTVRLDDLSLVRPQVAVTIKSSATTSYSGKSITLCGSVTPTAAIGLPAVLWVKKPGTSTWATVSPGAVYASGSSAAWTRTYAFTSGMARGTYQFKTGISGFPGYLGAYTSTIAVVLK